MDRAWSRVNGSYVQAACALMPRLPDGDMTQSLYVRNDHGGMVVPSLPSCPTLRTRLETGRAFCARELFLGVRRDESILGLHEIMYYGLNPMNRCQTALAWSVDGGVVQEAAFPLPQAPALTTRDAFPMLVVFVCRGCGMQKKLLLCRYSGNMLCLGY